MHALSMLKSAPPPCKKSSKAKTSASDGLNFKQIQLFTRSFTTPKIVQLANYYLNLSTHAIFVQNVQD